MYADKASVINHLEEVPKSGAYFCPASIGADEQGWAIVVDGEAIAFVDDEVIESLIVSLNLRAKSLQEVIK